MFENSLKRKGNEKDERL